MNKPEYLVRGGYVRSQNDGDRHYVSAWMVAHLYNVPLSKCILVDAHDPMPSVGRNKDLVELRPDETGKYRLPDPDDKDRYHPSKFGSECTACEDVLVMVAKDVRYIADARHPLSERSRDALKQIAQDFNRIVRKE